MKLSLAAIIAAVVLSACGGGSVSPLPIAISVTTSPASPAVGDSVTFVANAQGSGVTAMDADYGDGKVEAVQVPFARTVRNTFKHAYSAAGTYTAAFSVTQADNTTKSATATVQVH
jgi:PKD repeat protein